MPYMSLKDVNDQIRSGVRLIAEIGGFDNDYNAVINTRYKSDMFLRDLTQFIDKKNYKAIIESLKLEYPFMNFEKKEGIIADDERLVRRLLRATGFRDDDFFNPQYDKGNLIVWNDVRDKKDHLFKVDSVFMDSGAYYYNLRDLESGVSVGGRLRENELSEPTSLQKIIYYKSRGMLDVHLFNMMAFMTNEFDPSKCKIERENYSATQGAVKLFYDGEEIYKGSLDAGKMTIIDGKWHYDKTDEYWLGAIQKVYEYGDQYNDIYPLKSNYGLREKIQFLDALRGIDAGSHNQQIRDVAKAAQKGFIDTNSHYNALAMLSHDLNAPIKLPTVKVLAEGILEIEKLALRRLKNDDLGDRLQKRLDELKKEPKVIEKLSKNNLIKFDDIFKGNNLFESEIGKFYGSAHWNFSQTDPVLLSKIDKFYDNTREYLMERDILKLQRPDLEPLIKNLDLYYTEEKNGLVFFQGSNSKDASGFSFDIKTVVESGGKEVSQNWAELHLAADGFRREFYLAPTETYQGGANLGYCEGEFSLAIPKTKMDFEIRLESGIKFYIEDMNIDASRFNEIKNEISLKLGLYEEYATVQDFALHHDETCGTLSGIVSENKVVKDYL